MERSGVWVIVGPDGKEIYRDVRRPPPDIRYPKGSMIAAPGREFVALAGGS